MNVVTLKNHQGATARITDFGATLMSLQVADARGPFDDVVLASRAPKSMVLITPTSALPLAATPIALLRDS